MASEQIHMICHEGKTIDRVDDSWDHRLVEIFTLTIIYHARVRVVRNYIRC
jgi:hypothetical protein